MNWFKEAPVSAELDPYQAQLKQVEDFLKSRHPELFTASVSEQESLREDLVAREQAINDEEVLSLFEKYKIQATIHENPDGTFGLPVTQHFSAERLPLGYGYKGGAARVLLLRSLGLDTDCTPRDIDIVRIAEQEPEPGADHFVSEKFMPEDYSHGRGVEPIGEIARYLETRDLTINEIFTTDEVITMSRQCLLDTIRRVIRPTAYERERNSGSVSSAILSKIIRFYAEAIVLYGDASLADVDDMELEESFISPFYLALNLDRAMGRGASIAQSFVDELVERGQIPDHVDTAEEAAYYLNSLLWRGDFYYRHAPEQQFGEEYALLAEDEFEALPFFVGHGKNRTFISKSKKS